MIPPKAAIIHRLLARLPGTDAECGNFLQRATEDHRLKPMKTPTCLLAVALSFSGLAWAADAKKPAYQYKSAGIEVPAATPDEPKVKAFGPDTVKAAAKYLDDGSLSWVRERSCLACHSTGV